MTLECGALAPLSEPRLAAAPGIKLPEPKAAASRRTPKTKSGDDSVTALVPPIGIEAGPGVEAEKVKPGRMRTPLSIIAVMTSVVAVAAVAQEHGSESNETFT